MSRTSKAQRKQARKAAAALARSQTRAERDRQYRAALGIPDGQPLPAQIGTQASAGAARGGKGAAQRGKGRDK